MYTQYFTVIQSFSGKNALTLAIGRHKSFCLKFDLIKSKTKSKISEKRISTPSEKKGWSGGAGDDDGHLLRLDTSVTTSGH